MLGLSLSGGGARGAYQAGVILGLSEILDPLSSTSDPFGYYSGNSAGSINTTYCAAGTIDLQTTSRNLADLWSNLNPEMVYKTDIFTHSRIGLQWIRDLSLGSMTKRKMIKELLDISPLGGLLKKNIDFGSLAEKIEIGDLLGVSCSAFNYNEQRVVSFFQGGKEIEEWRRPKRYGRRVKINENHVLASCSIPVLFAPVQVGSDFYGDGTLRNSAPISPILHLGCQNVIFVGVRYDGPPVIETSDKCPPIAKVFGTLLNGLFFDSLDSDLERLKHINQIVESGQSKVKGSKVINFLHINPSRDLSEFAGSLSTEVLPSILQYLLGGLGGASDSSELASYLLFDSRYTKKLVEIGYEDALDHKEKVLRFWEKSKK